MGSKGTAGMPHKSCPSGHCQDDHTLGKKGPGMIYDKKAKRIKTKKQIMSEEEITKKGM